MSVLRQYIAPLFAVLIFGLALFAVSARIFLPDDMLEPAPIGDLGALTQPAASAAELPAPLLAFVRGLPDQPDGAEQL